MFTLAICNRRLSKAAAVYVQATKSWKLVKNFSEEETAACSGDAHLEVLSSVSRLDISPDELIELLRSVQTGVDLFCDHVVETDPNAKLYESAVCTAVSSMFTGCRCSAGYKKVDKRTIRVTHGTTAYTWNPDEGCWQFAPNSPDPDGSITVVGGKGNFMLSSNELTAMVCGYLDTFPLNSAGSFGVVYTMSCC